MACEPGSVFCSSVVLRVLHNDYAGGDPATRDNRSHSMPRGGKKLKNKRSPAGNHGDVTLNDFANSGLEAGKTRLKKGSLNGIVKTVEQMSNASHQEDLDWFDRDDFHFDSVPDDESTYEPVKVSIGDRNRRREKQSALSSQESKVNEDTGKTYPIDIWYILGAYIPPEDVGRFACICKSTYEVTQSTRFWSRLYKRYYTEIKGETLPIRLQPESMERMYGFKTCVIRSMYYLYPPFLERQKSRQGQEPHALIRRRCTMLWHQKGRGVYHYFFKMKESDVMEDDCMKAMRRRQPDLIEMLGDMNANAERGCKVLQVTCRTLASVPPTIFGQTLLTVSSVLASDFRSHCLRLIFGPPHAIHYSRQGKLAFSHIPDGSIGVCIDSVVMIKVLDWWGTTYPNPNEERPTATDTSGGIPADDFF